MIYLYNLKKTTKKNGFVSPTKRLGASSVDLINPPFC